MSKDKPKVKVEDIPHFKGIRVWYSFVDKAIIVRLDTEKWRVVVETQGDQVHIYKIED